MNAVDDLSRTMKPASGRFKFLRFSGGQRQSSLILCILLWSIISYLLISHFVLMAVEIRGASMSPTLLDGERYILFRCPYLWRTPRKGEIVVITDPEDQNLSIKRIVALPNEIIEIRRDGVYVNNAKLPEPYLTSFSSHASGDNPVKPFRLGHDDYFVLGDNRGRSADSRAYGPVPRKCILGLISKSE
ncbi:MAG: signal peptidase [Pedosphaera sp.]|nr:signal peptidase [Pedosphaera sp.]